MYIYIWYRCISLFWILPFVSSKHLRLTRPSGRVFSPRRWEEKMIFVTSYVGHRRGEIPSADRGQVWTPNGSLRRMWIHVENVWLCNMKMSRNRFEHVWFFILKWVRVDVVLLKMSRNLTIYIQPVWGWDLQLSWAMATTSYWEDDVSGRCNMMLQMYPFSFFGF
jgi:hypothetical protein